MNYLGLGLSAILLCASFGLSACSDKKMQMHGHMESMTHEGQTCWIFVDDNHRSYEVITPSHEVLKEGLQMFVRYEFADRQTMCGFPTVIDILEYRPDFAKDMH